MASSAPKQSSKSLICIECRGTSQSNLAGIPELLSSCNGCGISLHTTCANKLANIAMPVPLAHLVKKGSRWLCNECHPACGSCKNTNKGTCLLMCSTCDKNFHLSCLDPVPEKKPKCPWRYVQNVHMHAISLPYAAKIAVRHDFFDSKRSKIFIYFHF